MADFRVTCPDCRGDGYIWPPRVPPWQMCKRCDSLGTVWAPGAPGYGCMMTLAERNPGEIVELGNGDRGRIAWHIPRKEGKQVPETTFLTLISDFDDHMDETPRPFPSCLGVRSVAVQRVGGDDHAGDKGNDAVDPLLRASRAARGELL